MLLKQIKKNFSNACSEIHTLIELKSLLKVSLMNKHNEFFEKRKQEKGNMCGFGRRMHSRKAFLKIFDLWPFKDELSKHISYELVKLAA